jgi:hypothetical protein
MMEQDILYGANKMLFKEKDKPKKDRDKVTRVLSVKQYSITKVYTKAVTKAVANLDM